MTNEWITTTVANACYIDYGTRVVRKRDGGSIYPVYGGGGATFKIDTYNREDCLVVARFAISEKCTRFVKGKFFLNDSGLTIRSKDVLLTQEFLNWIIISKNDEIYSYGKGSAQKNLDMEDFRNMTITYPKSKSEQQRIVDILDAEFAKIDALKENAERNLQNAKDLFQAVLRKELEPKEGWDKKSIDEVVSDIFSGGDAPKDNMSKEPTEKYCVPIYANAVENDGLYGYTDYSRVHQPSITVSARGSGTGHTLRRYDSYLPIVRLIVIIPNSDIVLLDYIYYSLRSVKIDISGSAIPQLTVPMLKKHEVNYPVSLKEQQRIVSVLDDLSVKCCKIENNYKRSILLCNDLKQALLRKAFNGEL